MMLGYGRLGLPAARHGRRHGRPARPPRDRAGPRRRRLDGRDDRPAAGDRPPAIATLSLCSIMSTTGNRRYRLPRWRAFGALMAKPPSEPRGATSSAAVKTFRADRLARTTRWTSRASASSSAAPTTAASIRRAWRASCTRSTARAIGPRALRGVELPTLGHPRQPRSARPAQRRQGDRAGDPRRTAAADRRAWATICPGSSTALRRGDRRERPPRVRGADRARRRRAGRGPGLRAHPDARDRRRDRRPASPPRCDRTLAAGRRLRRSARRGVRARRGLDPPPGATAGRGLSPLRRARDAAHLLQRSRAILGRATDVGAERRRPVDAVALWVWIDAGGEPMRFPERFVEIYGESAARPRRAGPPPPPGAARRTPRARRGPSGPPTSTSPATSTTRITGSRSRRISPASSPTGSTPRSSTASPPCRVRPSCSGPTTGPGSRAQAAPCTRRSSSRTSRRARSRAGSEPGRLVEPRGGGAPAAPGGADHLWE